MKLTDDHVDRIENEIQSSSIRSKELKDDLLDHFCCAIEIYLSKKLSFDEAFAKAKMDVCPNGLNEIQEETIYLLNAKRIKIMKQIMFGSGMLFSMALSMGSLFKIMWWPGANNLIITGALGLGFIFFPLLAIHQYRLNANKILGEKLRYALGISSAIMFSLSIVFKMFHLMGANVLFILSMLIFTFGFLPFLFFRMYKKTA